MSESTTIRRDGLVTRLSSILLLQMQRIASAVFKRSQPRRMVLLEALELGNRRKLFLVACDEHRFLVGAGSDRIGTLVAIPETSSKTAPDTASGEVAWQAGANPVNALRGFERGRQSAWMARSASGRGSGRGLELVRRDSLACAPAGDKASEAGKTP
jgi:hypothetical protein